MTIRSWRAQGAFLIDAEWKGGKPGRISVMSERGEPCLVHGDWKVTNADGTPVSTDRDEFGRLRFKTVAGAIYSLTVL